MADSWPTSFCIFIPSFNPNEAAAHDVEKQLTLHTYGNFTSGKRLFPQVRARGEAETKNVRLLSGSAGIRFHCSEKTFKSTAKQACYFSHADQMYWVINSLNDDSLTVIICNLFANLRSAQSFAWNNRIEGGWCNPRLFWKALLQKCLWTEEQL